VAIDDPFIAKNFMGTRGFSRDVVTTFSNMSLNGDIINSDTVASAMDVIFKNATITGGISTATVKHAVLEKEQPPKLLNQKFGDCPSFKTQKSILTAN